MKAGLSAVLAAVVMATCLTGAFAGPIYLTIKGQKQGQFKGTTSPPSPASRIEAVGIEYDLTVPRDAAGNPTGKRRHSFLTVTKRLDASSPQLFAAAVSSEVLQVLIELPVPTADGMGMLGTQTVKLVNATVQEIAWSSTPIRDQTGQTIGVRPMEEVSFAFQRIEFTDLGSGTNAMDDCQIQYREGTAGGSGGNTLGTGTRRTRDTLRGNSVERVFPRLGDAGQ